MEEVLILALEVRADQILATKEDPVVLILHHQIPVGKNQLVPIRIQVPVQVQVQVQDLVPVPVQVLVQVIGKVQALIHSLNKPIVQLLPQMLQQLMMW